MNNVKFLIDKGHYLQNIHRTNFVHTAVWYILVINLPPPIALLRLSTQMSMNVPKAQQSATRTVSIPRATTHVIVTMDMTS